jgi:hypothetical protein
MPDEGPGLSSFPPVMPPPHVLLLHVHGGFFGRNHNQFAVHFNRKGRSMFHDEDVPQFSPEISPDLEAALQRARDAASGQRRIEEALRAAHAERAATQADLDAVRDRLSQSEAAQALTGSDPDKQARRRLLALRDDLEILQARIGGLESRLREATTTTTKARHDLAVAWRTWQQTQAAAFTDMVYTPAVAVFLDTLRLTAAVATALGNHRLHAIVRGLYLPTADDPHSNLANPKRMNWREYPDAATLYDRLTALRLDITRHMDGFTEPEANRDAA